MRINTKEKSESTTRLQKHNNTLRYCDLTNVSIEYLFRHCYFSLHAKSTPLFVYYGFQHKSYCESWSCRKQLRNRSRYGLSKSIVQRWRRNQATILSGELLKDVCKTCKNGPFHFQVSRTRRASNVFHSRETKYFICNVKWEEFLPSWVRLSFNAWETKDLIGGQKYFVVMLILSAALAKSGPLDFSSEKSFLLFFSIKRV